jgi:hypothetical protein
MNLVDFANSYMTFTVKDKSNSARIQLDARCTVTDRGRGTTEDFFLITPCKSERMYQKEKHFQDPNYDFCGIWSRKEYLILRTHAVHDPKRTAEWDPGANADRFAEVKIDLRTFPETQALTTDEQLVRATLKNLALVARTRVQHTDPHLSAVLEYPIKTMNVCEGTKRFQVDTGPLLLPDFMSKGARAVERFGLAFICYNTYDTAEFVLRQPTPVVVDGKEVCEVMHYSRIVSLSAKHEIFGVGKL